MFGEIVARAFFGDNVVSKDATLVIKTKRLMFYGGAKQQSHNNTFKNAANAVNKDYGETKAKAEDIIAIETAETIVDKINSEKPNSIQSIDIFSHGGRDALYFKDDDMFGSDNLYKNQKKESDHANYWWNDSKHLGDIDYNVFTDDAIIEFHGCTVGSYDEGLDAPFAEVMSTHLTKAGKSKAVTIGHGTKANPDQHKTLKGDDYRHGLRRVFYKGSELFTTKLEGRIAAKKIKTSIKNIKK